MKIDLQKIIALCRVLLLSFALISIGYMLGKNSVKADSGPNVSSQIGDHVAVYYLHSTFRCETCNRIEAMTKNLLEREYADYLSDGRMLWNEIDFMKNNEFAEKFEVAAPCVVVADIQNGEVRHYRRLDDVWVLIGDPQAFDAYLHTAIDLYLGGRTENE